MPRSAAALLAVLRAALAPAPSAAALFHDTFTVRDGLLTNEYRYWNHLPSRDSRWQMTSGSLFARGRTGWTGHPDGCASASKRGRPCNASDVNTRAGFCASPTAAWAVRRSAPRARSASAATTTNSGSTTSP